MLQANLFFTARLNREENFRTIVRVLREAAPQWATDMRFWDTPKSKPESVKPKVDLWEQFLREQKRSDKAIEALEKRFGTKPTPWKTNSVEFRGASQTFLALVDTDDRIVGDRPGNERQFMNSIAIHATRKSVENAPAASWMRDLMNRFLDSMDVYYGHACLPAEYEANNISSDRGRVEAIGVDHGGYLTGIYWLNIYGNELCSAFDGDVHDLPPAVKVFQRKHGIAVQLLGRPDEWPTDSYAAARERIRSVLGRRFFFDRRRRGRFPKCAEIAAIAIRLQEQGPRQNRAPITN